MDTAQTFSLGTLVSGSNSSGPSEVDIKVLGRGIFCQVVLEFSFSTDDASVARLFTIDRPWNAALTKIALNQDPIPAQADTSGLVPLPLVVKNGAEEALQEGASDAITCLLAPGQSLRTLTFTFVIACDVLWHQSTLSFTSPQGAPKVKVDFSWDLSGLPGAQLECGGRASGDRFSTLDGAKREWRSSLALQRGEELAVRLSLDQKKAASLCLYSEGEEEGCGAVVVVAPVRPQLVRQPVKIAVVVEIRNPQEGLQTRDLVDKLSSALNNTDQVAIWFMGSSVTRQVMEWTDAGQVTEEHLAQVLDPSLMGRTQYFWESYQRVLTECQEASHILLSSPGPKDFPPDDLDTRQPVFVYATGRRPNSSTLEDLAGLTGGCLSESSIDALDSFLKRVTIRLSPPLLRDFQLEGWGLEEVSPAGTTQVYTDRPTLIMGRYQGLLPQTVTLGGLSPAGQKLAQRVRVEKFTRFSLLPLFERRKSRQGLEEQSCEGKWGEPPFEVVEFSRPAELDSVFELEQSDAEASSDTLAPPAIDLVSTAVTLDDGMFSGPSDESIGDDFFEAPDPDQTIDDDIFAESSSSESEEDFFAQGSSPSVDDFFANSAEDDSPTFLDEEPTTQKSSLISDEASGLPRISISHGSGEGESPLESTGDTEPTKGTDTLSQEGEELDLSESSGELKLAQEPEVGSSESLDWGGFPSMDRTADEMGEIPRGDQLDSFSSPNVAVGQTSMEESSIEEPSVEESSEASRESAGSRESRESSGETVEPRSWSEKATVTVNNPFPAWAGHLVNLDADTLADWLSNCPIDHLALALVGTDENLVNSLLGKLDKRRKEAVETQMEWGKLLPEEELESATKELEALLSQS